MKKIILKMGLLCILSLLITSGFFATQASAQENPLEYTMLAPLPCVGDDQDCSRTTNKTELQDYVPGAFKLAVGLATVAAVLNIIYGGFQYMTTDAVQNKSAGKERIKHAIYALVLIIGAWLILATINPNLLNINLNIEPVTVNAPSAPTATTQTVNGTVINLNTRDQLLTEQQASTLLTAAGFGFSSTGNCSDRTRSNCTSVDRIHSDTVDGLIAMRSACGSACARLVISGGTETGHACNNPATCISHESGFKVDISYRHGNGEALRTFLGQQVQAQRNTPMTTDGFYNISIGGFNYQIHPEGDHMDITVIPR